MNLVFFSVELLYDAPNGVDGITIKKTRQKLNKYCKTDFRRIFRCDVTVSNRYHSS